jgi:hypothetical protein
VLLPLSLVGAGAGVLDLSAESVADGLERLLAERPSPAECMAWAARFAPEVAVPLYRAALEEGLEALARTGHAAEPLPAADVPAAPARGLLAAAAPITRFGWRELFDCYVPGAHRARMGAGGEPGTWDRLKTVLLLSTRAPLERFAAGLPLPPGAAGGAEPEAPGRGDLVERLWGAATSPAVVPGGRIICLAELSSAGRVDLLQAGLDRLESEGHGGAGVDYLRAEAAAGAGDFAEAMRLCVARLETSPAAEHEPHRVRHVASIARRWGRPELALPWLCGWLDRFPDAQESGPTWLELAMTAARSGEEHARLSDFALGRARALLGEAPVVRRAEHTIAGRRARAVLA